MKSLKSIAVVTIVAMTLAGCSSLNPNTLINAARGHAEFPSLSVAILECTASRPDVQAEIQGPFNILADAWIEASNYEPNAELLTALANGRSKLESYQDAWLSAKASVVASGLDCGPWVTAAVVNIENTFSELTDALDKNAKLVLVLDYARLFADIFGGRNVRVTRMPVA